MNKEQRETVLEWIEALRDGRFKQWIGTLKDSLGDSYCCLGVLGVLNNKLTEEGGKWKSEEFWEGESWEDETEPNPVDFVKLTGFDRNVMYNLMSLNDNKGYTFEEIADYIEEKAELICGGPLKPDEAGPT